MFILARILLIVSILFVVSCAQRNNVPIDYQVSDLIPNEVALEYLNSNKAFNINQNKLIYPPCNFKDSGINYPYGIKKYENLVLKNYYVPPSIGTYFREIRSYHGLIKVVNGNDRSINNTCTAYCLRYNKWSQAKEKPEDVQKSVQAVHSLGVNIEPINTKVK